MGKNEEGIRTFEGSNENFTLAANLESKRATEAKKERVKSLRKGKRTQ